MQKRDVTASPDCSSYPVLAGGDAGVAGGGIEVTGTPPVTEACTPAARQIRAKSRISSKNLRPEKDLVTSLYQGRQGLFRSNKIGGLRYHSP